jgi:dihydropteroate synthase
VTQGRATLAGVPLGDGLPVAVMGALNVSPESFHAGSVHSAPIDLVRAARALAEAGAALIDVGARSTAPYGGPDIGEAEERDRLARAVELLVSKVPVPISADTTRPEPARAALEAGARVINDVSGLRDPRVAALVAKFGAGVILTASPRARQGSGGCPRPVASAGDSEDASEESAPRLDASVVEGAPPIPYLAPVATVRALLAAALGRARAAGIPEERIVLDPGIGFFRDEGLPWDEWDARVLAGLGEFGALGRPLCVAVSRKSFIGAITGRTSPGERLAGSLAATAVAVLGGAALVRAHDVAETVDAVRVAERIRKASQVRTGPYNKDRP